MQKYGSPVELDEDALHSAFLRLVADQVQLMFTAHEQHTGTPAPTFVITYGADPQAFAAVTEEGHTFVGVTLGKAIGLLRYFQCSLTHPSTLTRGVAGVVGSDTVRVPGRAESYREHHVPTHEGLSQLAEGLARFALMFIAGHELGHIAHGHLLGHGRTGVALWDEETEASNNLGHFSQAARELAADRYGGDVLGSYLLNLRSEGMPISLLVHYAQFAVYSLFHVERRREDWIRTFFKEDHPPVQFRQVTGVAGLDTALTLGELLSTWQIMALTEMSMQRALEVYEAVTGTTRSAKDSEEFARFAHIQPGIVQALLDEHRRLYPESSAQADDSALKLAQQGLHRRGTLG